jgi:hypothetical protein
MNGIVSGEILSTRNYEQFIINPEYNRDLSFSHIKKIKKSIQQFGDMGSCFPIVVDETGLVIDGQHRFTARKELKLPIYFIQSAILDSKILGGINDAIAKWKPADFQKSAQQTSVYKLVKEFVEEIDSSFTFSIVCGVFSIKKDMLVVDDEVNYNYVNRKLLGVKHYVLYLQKVISNKLTSRTTKINTAEEIYSAFVLRLAIKMAKHMINISNIPYQDAKSASFMDIEYYLVGNELIK